MPGIESSQHPLQFFERARPLFCEPGVVRLAIRSKTCRPLICRLMIQENPAIGSRSGNNPIRFCGCPFVGRGGLHCDFSRNGGPDNKNPADPFQGEVPGFQAILEEVLL
jgi:hypothetical protein